MPESRLNRRGVNLLAIISVLSLSFLIGFQVPAFAEIEDVLFEKGVITKEDWVKIKADKEKIANEGKGLEYRAEAPKHEALNFLKGLEIGVVFYMDLTYAQGDSFTANRVQKGLNETTAENNRGLAQGFHFTRTYLNVRKYFEGDLHSGS